MDYASSFKKAPRFQSVYPFNACNHRAIVSLAAHVLAAVKYYMYRIHFCLSHGLGRRGYIFLVRSVVTSASIVRDRDWSRHIYNGYDRLLTHRLSRKFPKS